MSSSHPLLIEAAFPHSCKFENHAPLTRRHATAAQPGCSLLPLLQNVQLFRSLCSWPLSRPEAHLFAHATDLAVAASPACVAEATWYKPNGQVQKSTRIPVTDEPQSVRAFRDEIALLVVKEAQRQFPQAVNFHFNTPVNKIDLKQQTVSTSLAGSSTTTEVHIRPSTCMHALPVLHDDMTP